MPRSDIYPYRTALLHGVPGSGSLLQVQQTLMEHVYIRIDLGPDACVIEGTWRNIVLHTKDGQGMFSAYTNGQRDRCCKYICTMEVWSCTSIFTSRIFVVVLAKPHPGDPIHSAASTRPEHEVIDEYIYCSRPFYHGYLSQQQHRARENNLATPEHSLFHEVPDHQLL
jgi:hypothetical protein